MQTSNKRVRFADEDSGPTTEEFGDGGWSEAAAQNSNRHDGFYGQWPAYNDFPYDARAPYEGDQSFFEKQDNDLPYSLGGLGGAEENDTTHVKRMWRIQTTRLATPT